MEYLNLQLKISARGEDSYLVSISSQDGEESASIPLLLDDEDFRNEFQTVERLTRGSAHSGGNPESISHAARDLHPIDDDDEPCVDSPDTVCSFGTRLFEWVFVGDVRSVYRTSLATARREKKGLRLRLHLNAPEVAALPWEFLYDKSQGEYISLVRETPIVRYVDMARASQSITVEPPLRILAMTASPKELPPLDVASERKQVDDAIGHLVESGSVELEWLEGQTWKDLRSALLRKEWHIFHFIGHGSFDEAKDEGCIALEDSDGKLEPLSATRLARILAGQRSVRLAVLNCCEGAKGSHTNLFSSAGAVLTRRDIPAVVSMQYAITDTAAIEFSRILYDSIAEGEPVDSALQAARVEISLSNDDTIEWATPVLHMRTPDGRLFDIDVKSAVFRDAPEPSRWDMPFITDADLAAASAPRSEDLSILLVRMRNRVADLLGKGSAGNAQLIDLEMEVMRDAVSKPTGDGGESIDLSHFFQSRGGSILMLGDPGSGKSTSLLMLARDLIARAQRDSSAAVPILVSLSAWQGEPIMDWIVEQIRVDFTYPPEDIDAFLRDHQLLLLLDGLDEVAEWRREACVDALNEMAPQVGKAGMAVCCRTREYIQLPNRLALTAAVKIQGMTREKVFSEVESWGSDYRALLKLLKLDSALQILARSPLMLGLMAEVYRGLPEETFHSGCASQSTSAAERRDALMARYVARMFAKVEQESRHAHE